MSVVEVTHPLVHQKLGLLRARETGPEACRRLVSELALLLAYEATRELALEPLEVSTPLGSAAGGRLRRGVALCPILRAGVGMLEAVLSLLPAASVGFLGIARDEETLAPLEYYSKLPPLHGLDVLVLDPMLATGGSSSWAAAALERAGAASVAVVALIAAPEGIARLEREHPGVRIVVAAIDSHLDARGFIVPGLGDAGDRLYGTG